MCIETNTHKNWNPYRALAVTGIWLVLVVLIAFALGSGCGGGNPPAPTNGALSLAWSITDQSGRPATCAQVSARSVALRLRNRAGGDIVATAFPCEASPGTAQVAPAVYDITIELHAADGTRLATARDQTGVGIVAGRMTALTPVTFATNTQGSLAISIATSATTNCGSVTAGGAGITGTTVTLERAEGGCAPVTFVRSLGGKQVGTYTVNCSSPAVVACIEKTETLTTDLEAGKYIIRVRGKIGAIDCWKRDDTLEVPPPGKPLVHAVGLVRQNLPGC